MANGTLVTQWALHIKCANLSKFKMSKFWYMALFLPKHLEHIWVHTLFMYRYNTDTIHYLCRIWFVKR
jgi:hypothetical protein